MVSGVIVFISVPRTMFTPLEKPGFMLVVKTTPCSTRASSHCHWVNCLCSGTRYSVITPISHCLTPAWTHLQVAGLIKGWLSEKNMILPFQHWLTRQVITLLLATKEAPLK